MAAPWRSMAAAAVVAAATRRALIPAAAGFVRPARCFCEKVSSQPDQYTGVKISYDDFHYVERLIPPLRVPTPPKHEHYPTPSGWSPPRDPPPALPYFVKRTRMHNIPVYQKMTHGNRELTVISNIEGDIWVLEKEVRELLKTLSGEEPLIRVNEVSMKLTIRGYFDTQLKGWLLEKGF
ncbi:unnamed protein product [Lampetra planeri]